MTNSIETSIPKARKVRGYTIDRMPIGRFLQATQTLQDLPTDVLKRLFPEADGVDLLRELAGMTRESFQALVMRAVAVLPAYAVRLFAELSGIGEDKLLTDPHVGLDGLAEMAMAWVDVNGIENFTRAAGALADKVRRIRTGSKG